MSYENSKSKQQVLEWLGQQQPMEVEMEIAYGPLTIRRGVQNYNIRWGSVSYAEGRIPVHVDAGSFPLDMAGFIVGLLKV